MTPRRIRGHCQIDPASERMIESAMTRLGLSARAYDRILKASRTITDLDGSDCITYTHVSEAVGTAQSKSLCKTQLLTRNYH